MPTKFQFESVMKLIGAGVKDYIRIRQQVGLTSDELDDILNNISYYKEYFEKEEQIKTLKKLNGESENIPWWKKWGKTKP